MTGEGPPEERSDWDRHESPGHLLIIVGELTAWLMGLVSLYLIARIFILPENLMFIPGERHLDVGIAGGFVLLTGFLFWIVRGIHRFRRRPWLVSLFVIPLLAVVAAMTFMQAVVSNGFTFVTGIAATLFIGCSIWSRYVWSLRGKAGIGASEC